MQIPFMQRKRQVVWMQQSNTLVAVTSSPAAVVVEAFDPVVKTTRSIPLAKNAADPRAFLADETEVDANNGIK